MTCLHLYHTQDYIFLEYKDKVCHIQQCPQDFKCHESQDGGCFCLIVFPAAHAVSSHGRHSENISELMNNNEK